MEGDDESNIDGDDHDHMESALDKAQRCLLLLTAESEELH